MAEKFKKGDTLVYDTYGLCLVKEIRNMSFSKTEPKQDYYILSPLSNTVSTYYVPVNNEKATVKLRLPMTEKQIELMLTQAKCSDCHWIENRQVRVDNFHSILKKGISEELVSLLHCIYLRKQTLSQKGKNISSTDEGIFSLAERILNEEISYSLGIEQEKVSEYISSFLEKNK